MYVCTVCDPFYTCDGEWLPGLLEQLSVPPGEGGCFVDCGKLPG